MTVSKATVLVAMLIATAGPGFWSVAVAQMPSSGPAADRTPTALPKDVFPDSRFRLPLPKREELDAQGRKFYDEAAKPGSRNLAGLHGPSGIRLYSPELAERARAVNQYLRFESGLDPRVRELAILVTAREMNSQFEWTAHELAGRKEGLPQKIIDIVKYRRPIRGLPETDAVVIELGRQMFGDHKVPPATFARALKIFGRRGIVNLVSLMGEYSGTAALLAAFDMQLPPGQKPLLPLP